MPSSAKAKIPSTLDKRPFTPKYTSSKTLTNIILDTNLSKFKTILFAKFPTMFFKEFNVRKITTNQFYIQV